MAHTIKQYGDPTKATTLKGKNVTKEEKLWMEGYGFVKTAPYGNHFVYAHKGLGSTFMCTCGSMAVAVGTTAYAHLGSPDGWLLVCQHHTSFNRHADGSQ